MLVACTIEMGEETPLASWFLAPPSPLPAPPQVN